MSIPMVGNIPAPSYRREGTTDTYEHLEGNHGGIRVLLYSHEGEPLFTAASPGIVRTIEYAVQEQKTQADAVDGVVTFAEGLTRVGIFNTDPVNEGVFTVNGITITVPPDTAFEATIGGVPNPAVAVSGATSYIITRYG